MKENYSVLLVDDETFTRTLIGDYINNLPGVRLAASLSNGFGAKRYLMEHPVDIVITDIKMPLMDGLELAAFIKENYPGCIVIIVSAYGEFDYAQKAIRFGVTDYLLKPVKLEQIEDVIRKSVDRLESGMRGEEKTSDPSAEKRENEENQVREIDLALRYMADHLERDLSRNEVAERVYLSPSYFSRLFKSETGMGFGECLLQMRMNRAKELLAQNKKVREVAAAVGFKDTKYFSVIFEKHTGCLPSEYRKSKLRG